MKPPFKPIFIAIASFQRVGMTYQPSESLFCLLIMNEGMVAYSHYKDPIGFVSPFTHDHFNPNEFSTIKLN